MRMEFPTMFKLNISNGRLRQIKSAWYIRSPSTEYYIYSEIFLDWGLGGFKKDTNELVSWILESENFCPGFDLDFIIIRYSYM